MRENTPLHARNIDFKFILKTLVILNIFSVMIASWRNGLRYLLNKWAIRWSESRVTINILFVPYLGALLAEVVSFGVIYHDVTI